jgi:hypothetical protein
MIAPSWYSQLAEWMIDSASPAARPGCEVRLAAIEAAGTDLDAAGWRRAHLVVLGVIVRSCREHAPEACDPVLALLAEGAESGDPRWAAAEEAARAARAARVEEAAARAAARAARAARAVVAAWAWSVWAWAVVATSESSPDRIIDAILSALEREVNS